MLHVYRYVCTTPRSKRQVHIAMTTLNFCYVYLHVEPLGKVPAYLRRGHVYVTWYVTFPG